MSIIDEFRESLRSVHADALRSAVAELQPMMTSDFRALVATYPELGELTLGELFGDSSPSETRGPSRLQSREGAKKPKAPRQVRQPFVGRRMRELRKQVFKLTRNLLSEAIGVPVSAIARLEIGRNVRLSTYFPIIEYFIAREPQVWMIAERVVRLTAGQRAELMAFLDSLESG